MLGTAPALRLWVEAWGTDHGMRPGEESTAVAEAEHEQSSFDVAVRSGHHGVDELRS
ncbi:hypothetical protein AB0D65_07850 [Streptomyces griseoloalbus]|uniref:Uncharacterized protein n=1 Tax=Streptomyces griseoloalbus TaxID=67303 RepID=A0ABV3E193_9ACTN